MHDVVAHAMVTINVQAGVGAHLLDRDPAQAYDTLRTIKQVSGDALTDLRAMLGLLREDGAGDAPRRRCSASRTCGDLRDTLGAAGVDVAFDVDPAARSLPAVGRRDLLPDRPGGAHQHPAPRRVRPPRASGSPARDDSVDARGARRRRYVAAAPLRDTGSGHGLRGMRERVAALGRHARGRSPTRRRLAGAASLP